MPTLYSFLFFLQKQTLYFKFQDRILDILSSDPTQTLSQIEKRIEQLNPQLVQHTRAAMDAEPNPFPSIDIHRVKYGDPDYPDQFTRLIDPPLVFSYLGPPIWKRELIAIVGSRLPSQKSVWWLSKELKNILSKNQIVSVSGGAMGVDQWVHQASVDLKLPTLAVLPSGLSDLYPKSFASMSKSILEMGGCLLSEFPDAQSVRKYHFSYRNRLIAALGKVSIIVEAREKSGSLITAHRALEMGKDIFVVPGHPLDDSFRGSLQLLKLGAHIITVADDIDYWC